MRLLGVVVGDDNEGARADAGTMVFSSPAPSSNLRKIGLRASRSPVPSSSVLRSAKLEKRVSINKGSDGVMGGKGISVGLRELGVAGEDREDEVQCDDECDEDSDGGLGNGRARGPRGLFEVDRERELVRTGRAADGGGAKADGGKLSFSRCLSFPRAMYDFSSLPRLRSRVSALVSSFGLSIKIVCSNDTYS